MDIATCLGGHPVFNGLAARALSRLAASASLLRLTAGETSNVLEHGGTVLFAIEGLVRISTLADGRVGFVDVEAGGDFAFDLAIAGQNAPPHALLAMQDSVVVLAPAATVVAAAQSSAAAAFAMARLMADRLIASSAAEPGPLQMVFRDLLRTARPIGESRWSLDPMPRHRELAARAGVTEDAAAAAIAHLVRLGVARRRYPALDIEDRDALQRLAG